MLNYKGEDEIWFGKYLHNKYTHLFIDSGSENKFYSIELSLEDLQKLRTEINNQILRMKFNVKINENEKEI